MNKEDQKGWKDLVTNGLQEFDGSSNVRYDFTKMSKRFGKYYLDYLSAAYSAKDEMPDSEFQEINGNIPDSFMSKLKSMSAEELISNIRSDK